MSELDALIEKLKSARFTGELRLRFSSGAIEAAELRHHLANSEFQTKELPTVEGQKEMEFEKP